jgi:DNA modification methylase
MNKEYISIDLKILTPHPKNPKDHDIEAIKDSIKHNGNLDPIEIDEKNVILSGHGRWQAMIELGIFEDKVIRYSGLTEEQKEDYILRSNTTTMSRGFFDEKLKLFDSDVLSNAGFKSSDIDRIFKNEQDYEDDFNGEDEYDKIKETKTKEKQIFQLGKHRLMCGDSTNEEDVKLLMDNQKADMIFSDPPYNVNYHGRKHGGIKNDNMSDEDFIDFTIKFIKQMSLAVKKGGVFYICSGFSSYPIFRYAIESTNLFFSGLIIWVKNNASLGWNDYRHKHELILKVKNNIRKKAECILYGWNGGKHFFSGDKFESDVWEINRRAGNTMVHPTQKPLAMVNKAIKNSSLRGGAVLDLFGGSGSTLISCEKLDRQAYIMELDPIYCDVIISRWEKMTNQKAKLIE